MKKSETIFQKFVNWSFTLGLAFVMIFHVLSANASNLKFAQVSDAHYTSIEKDTSYKVLSSSPKILEDVILQINEIPDMNFVLFTGDLVNLPIKNQLLEFISRANCLKCPWYAALGNHDVQQFKMEKTTFFDILCGHNPNFNHRNPFYSFSPKKGYKVICLDTIILDKMTANGEITKDQLEWLDKELKASKGEIIIIGMHVPIVEPYSSKSHQLLNKYEVLEVLHKYKNPIIVCSGHFHGTKIVQDDNILFVDSPSLVTYPCAYRVININTQKKKVIVDIYTKNTRVGDALNNAKLKVMASSFLLGTEEDRNNTLEIIKK